MMKRSCKHSRGKKGPMFAQRRANFDREDDPSKPWAKTGAWFLGPKGDNAEIFKQLVADAVDKHILFRSSYYPCDPHYVTDEMRNSESFKGVIAKTKSELHNIQKELIKAVPFFTPRYKGHVTWDTVMPANLGYLTGLLFNQNNCAAEASSVTTKYELEVGIDLCKMVGFDPDKAMGHLVTGGTLANIESMWAARNIKYYPLGLQDAIKNEPVLDKAKNDFTVYLPHKQDHVRIVDATTWELLNLDVDEIVAMPEKIASMCSITNSDLLGIMTKYGLESIGIQDFTHRHHLKTNPCSLASTTAHVSLFKGATILGVGKEHLIPVPVDDNARMDVKGLRDILEDKLANQIPVISVVAILGTTEESAVDPLVDILEIRAEMRSRGLTFMVHGDGAWGGYFCTMLRTPPTPMDENNEGTSWFTPELALSNYVHDQLSAVPNIDTITIDPHKSGFCPYPGGATCYRDKRMNNFLGITNQVVYYHGSVNLGDVGIEGSKPGAAAAGVVMAHRVIGLHKNGYGRMLSECMFTSKLLYCYFVALAEPDDPFFIVPTKPLPPDRTREEHIQYMRDHVIGKTNDEIAEDEELMLYLQEIGPDTMLPCFSINLKGNSDVNLVNDLVQAVFKDLCMSDDRVSAFRFPMLVTASTYKHNNHSTALKEFKKRLGVDPYDTTGVKYIMTTCMDAYVSTMDFLDDLASILRNTILCSIGTVTDPNTHHDLIASSALDTQKHMVLYYAGQFPNVSHQYNASAKCEFMNPQEANLAIKGAADRNGPLVLRGVEPNRIHDMLLYDYDQGDAGRHKVEIEVFCYSGLPSATDTPFMRTKIGVVDVARFDHFDLNVTDYPEKSKYFLYGSKDRAFISHIPVMQPDFLQLLELDGIPEGITPLLVNYGIEIEMPFHGKPEIDETTNTVINPITKSSYTVSYIGEAGKSSTTTINIGREIFFDGAVVNGV